MALSQAELQSLERASLVKFFDANRAVWEELYDDAREYVQKYISSPATLRQDDVIEALVPALGVTKLLTDELSKKKLRQKYWRDYFADLIVDSFWAKEG